VGKVVFGICESLLMLPGHRAGVAIKDLKSKIWK